MDLYLDGYYPSIIGYLPSLVEIQIKKLEQERVLIGSSFVNNNELAGLQP